MKTKRNLLYTIILCIAVTLTSCWSTKILQPNEVVLNNNELIVACTKTDGTKIDISRSGSHREEAGLLNDTLAINYYKRSTIKGQKEYCLITLKEEKIPLSEIHTVAVRSYPNTLKYTSLDLGLCGVFSNIGVSFGIGYSVIWKNLGVSLRGKISLATASNDPEDEDIFGPARHEIDMISLLLAMQSSNGNIGLEIGPSFEGLHEWQPDRDSESHQVFGLFIRGDIRGTSENFGIGIAFWGNVNRINSVLGVELSIAFGLVRRPFNLISD